MGESGELAQLKIGFPIKRRRLTGPPTQQSGPMAVLVPLAHYPILERSWLYQYHVHSSPIIPDQTVTTGRELAPFAQVAFELGPVSKATGHDPQVGPFRLLLPPPETFGGAGPSGNEAAAAEEDETRRQD